MRYIGNIRNIYWYFGNIGYFGYMSLQFDWQMPNNIPPEDVGGGVVNKNPPYFYEGKS